MAWAEVIKDQKLHGGGDDDPDGGGDHPDGGGQPEPKKEKAESEPAQAGNVLEPEEEKAPIDRSLDIPDPLIRAARQRHPVASAPQDTPVPPAPAPATPPAPTPPPPPAAPTPTPAPSRPKPRSWTTYQPGMEDDPGWRELNADELEARIRHARNKRYGGSERQRQRRLKHFEEMEDRLDVLRAADRAASRSSPQPAGAANV